MIFIENESTFLLVKEMEYPELPAFDIEKATKVLQDYKKEVEEIPGLKEVRDIKKTADQVKNLTKFLK
jgi:hypothetical protein